MSRKKRIGFHYIPDTKHYRNNDLDHWLPKLCAMEASWLILSSPMDRAIPEDFIKRLLASQIEPVLQFSFTPSMIPELGDIKLLLEIYAKWGVSYISLFDKPNLRSFWEAANWSKGDLVERFLDIFLPLAELTLDCDLIPIFPPLEPGGDYWDTVFLKTALQGIKRRGHTKLLKNIVIGAFSRTNGHPLNWGIGGPERWPDMVPYSSSQKTEDHRGFRIYDWYQAIIQSCLIKPRPIFLFEVCSSKNELEDIDNHTQNAMSIVRLLAGEPIPNIAPIPKEVIGASFWLLADATSTKVARESWFKPDGTQLPIVDFIQSWSSRGKSAPEKSGVESKVIKHYLLRNLVSLKNKQCRLENQEGSHQ